MEINFIRRLYYDLSTGEVLAGIYREGDIIHTPPEDDFVVLETLEGRSLADVGLLEWLEKDAEIEAALAVSDISVDITADPPELVFRPIVIPEKPPDQRDEVMQILGVEVD